MSKYILATNYLKSENDQMSHSDPISQVINRYKFIKCHLVTKCHQMVQSDCPRDEIKPTKKYNAK